MDLGKYMKGSEKMSRINQREKRCMQCDKILQNDGSHIYYQRFCSQLCKDMYVQL